MKFLFLHNGSDLYGASRSLIRLTTQLVREGHDVLVVLPSSGSIIEPLSKGKVSYRIQQRLAIIDRQTFRNIKKIFRLITNFFFSVGWLSKLITEYQPDIIHSNTSVIITGAITAKLRRIPHIWHIRESFQEFGVLWKLYQYFMYGFSDKIICVSGPMKEQFNKKLSQQKICVIHNGFPSEEFEPVNVDRIQAFKNSCSLYGSNLLIGVVGRIKLVRKGQDVFVNAAALLHDHHPDVRFLCIGSPYPGNEPHLEKLLDLIRELHVEDYVIYTGQVEDIKAALSALDILVLASTQPEPFGGVVIEAMAFGKPVVATRCGGSIEQVVDGETGYLVTPGDPQSMADAIESLLKDPQKRLKFGERGRRRFLEKFEFNQFFAKIMDVYTSIK